MKNFVDIARYFVIVLAAAGSIIWVPNFCNTTSRPASKTALGDPFMPIKVIPVDLFPHSRSLHYLINRDGTLLPLWNSYWTLQGIWARDSFWESSLGWGEFYHNFSVSCIYISSCVDFELWIGQKAKGRRQRGSKSTGKGSPIKDILRAKTPLSG